MATVITFGTFDLLHVGHVRLLRRARALGTRLVVGISSDALSQVKKGRAPLYRQAERMEIVQAIAGVDEVFSEDTLEQKRDYILGHRAGILAMGSDWTGCFDDLGDICKVVYLPRTEGVSTTALLRSLRPGTGFTPP